MANASGLPSSADIFLGTEKGDEFSQDFSSNFSKPNRGGRNDNWFTWNFKKKNFRASIIHILQLFHWSKLMLINFSGIIDTYLKLGKMTLNEHLRDNSESESRNKNSVDLNLSQTQNSDNGLQSSLDNCSEFTFDNVIGHLEDMLIDEDFYKVQNGFLEKYWKEFEDSEENKHSYMAIFNEYTHEIEDFIVCYLKKRISNFEMERFAAELKKRQSTLEGEIFEVLLTLSDFTAFKETFLDYKAMKEGHTVDLSSSLCVSSVQY